MGQYDWLAEKKREAMMKKLMRRGMPRYAQIPVSERYGVSYTGLGPDGKLQDKAPAGIDYSTNPPHLFHEGETKIDTPEGSTYINADVTQLAMPATEKEQNDMSMLEGRLPGYATGGFYSGVMSNLKAKGATSPVENIAKKLKDRLTKAPTEVKAAGQRSQAAEQPQIQAPTEQAAQQPQISVAPVQRQQPAAAPQIQAKAPQQQPAAPISVKPVTREPQQLPEPPQLQAKESPVMEASRNLPTEEDYRAQGMEGISNIATEGARSINVEGQRMLDQQAAEQAAELDALKQKQAQLGTDSDVARTEVASLNARHEGARNDLAAQYGIEGMKAQEGAYGELASQGLAGQQFTEGQRQFNEGMELQKEQDKIAQDWNNVNFKMQQGDFAGAAEQFKEMTGGGVDMSKIEEQYDFAIKSRDADALGASIQNAIGLLNAGVLDEQTAEAFGSVVKKAALSQIGLQIGDQFSEQDWNDIDAVLNSDGLETNAATEKMSAVAQNAVSAVEGIREWDKLQIDNPDMFNPDSKDYDPEKIGRLASALISQETNQLDDDERALLKESGVYNKSKDVVQKDAEQNVQQTIGEYRDLISQGRYQEAENLYKQLPEGTLPPHEEMQITSKLETSNNAVTSLTKEERDKVLESIKSGDPKYADIVIRSNDPGAIENIPTVAWSSDNPGSDKDRWALTDAAKKWVEENKGKIYTASNGRMYIVNGIHESKKDRNSTEYIELQDAETGKIVGFNNAAGKSEGRGLPPNELIGLSEMTRDQTKDLVRNMSDEEKRNLSDEEKKEMLKTLLRFKT